MLLCCVARSNGTTAREEKKNHSISILCAVVCFVYKMRWEKRDLKSKEDIEKRFDQRNHSVEDKNVRRFQVQEFPGKQDSE